MEITAGMVRRGYVLTDYENDTHGFRKQGERVWVKFTCDEHWHKRSVWVDYLGDRYVLNLESSAFTRLLLGREIWTWAPVDESCPNVVPKMAREVL